jgi:MYXO-CTERM domain-containing protein
LTDSPWVTEVGALVVEDFEDAMINATGLSATGGSIRNPGTFTDSVDYDDGAMDGWGQQGHSYWALHAQTPMRFQFNSVTLGYMPTVAGLVWTDGSFAATVYFEALDTTGTSLGIHSYVIGDNNDGAGQTPEDRFLGVETDAGISELRIWTSAGGLEVDHIQYGLTNVPAPGALALLGIAGLATRRRRRA